MGFTRRSRVRLFARRQKNAGKIRVRRRRNCGGRVDGEFDRIALVLLLVHVRPFPKILTNSVLCAGGTVLGPTEAAVSLLRQADNYSVRGAAQCRSRRSFRLFEKESLRCHQHLFYPSREGLKIRIRQYDRFHIAILGRRFRAKHSISPAQNPSDGVF